MKLYKILYSRSLSKDYRWMLIPPRVSTGDLRILRDIYEEYDAFKESEMLQSLHPVYCINVSEFSALFTCTTSKQEDQFGREIYALEGLLVYPEYRRHFWFILPWLLVNRDNVLSVWRELDVREADNLRNSVSPVISLDILMNGSQFGELKSGIVQNLDSKGYDRENIQVVEYSHAGLDELTRIVWSPFVPLLDFAFGASPKIASLHKWNIVSYVVRPYKHSVYNSKSGISASRIVKPESQQRHTRYDVLYVEWTRRGVFVHGRRAVIEEVETSFFQKLRSRYPKMQVDYSLSHLPFPNNQWQQMELIRFHRLDGNDEYIGQLFVDNLTKSGKWERFFPNNIGKYQGVWLRRRRKDTAPNHAFTRPAFGGK